ncbi:hypothetical protein GF345_03930 [Candidatus Woesearchaeota archaeon]|nr:hypothetical protein [Candidatus Woesearchaeota archaeon]
MNKKRVYIALYALILLSILANAVHAQLLEPILEPIARLNIIGIMQGPLGIVVDTILLFVILLGAAQAGLGDRFSNNKSIGVAVGIALAIAAAYGEYVTDFRLIQLWPLAMLMAVLAIGFAAYNYFKQISGTQNRGFAMLGFAFLFYYFTAVVPALADYFRESENAYMQLIWAVLNLVAIVCLIWGIIDLFRGLIGGAGGGSGGGSSSGGGGPGGGAGGGGGPGLWNRFWDWRDKRKEDKERSGATLDYENPGTVKLKVVDLHDNPINGANVTITGAKDWSYRDQEITGPDGNIQRDFTNVPSGQLHIEVRHPNYKFWSLQLGTTKNKRHRQITLKGGETADVLVRLSRVEQNGEVKGRIIDEDKAKAESKVNRKSDGVDLNNPNYDIGNKQGRQVVALERIERGRSVEYVDMGIHGVTADANGYFHMQKLPMGKNFVIGTPIDISGHKNCYLTHLGIVIDNILYRGTKYGRGGQGGENPQPPTDIHLGRYDKLTDVVDFAHEKGLGKIKHIWNASKSVGRKISRLTKYYGNEENVVISFSKTVGAIGTVKGRVVNGSYVTKHMNTRPPKYTDANDIMTDVKRWPQGPGLPNFKVRAVYSYQDASNPRIAGPWVPAGVDGNFTINVPIIARNILIEAEKATGSPKRIGVHLGWTAPPTGSPSATFDLTPAGVLQQDVLVPIWGITLPEVKVVSK